MRSVVAGVMLSCVSVSLGQSFSELPDTYTQDPELWRSLFAKASNRMVHAVMLGDSQETTPQGWGNVYIPALLGHFADHLGGCGMTPWSQAGASFGGGSPWAEWLVRGAAAPPCVSIVEQTLPWLPPGMRSGITSATHGNNANNNQRYGWLLVLDPTANWTHPGALVTGPRRFDTSQGVYLDLMAVTRPGSSELRMRISATAGDPNYYAPTITEYTSSMGLDAPAGQIRQQTFGPIMVAPGSKPQAEIYGNDPERTATIISARYRSVANHKGLVITDLSEGGYRAAVLLRDHAQCGPVLAAIAPDFAFITYGANEAGNGVPLEAYESTVTAAIAFVRQSVPNLPIIIIPDVDRQLSTPDWQPLVDGLSARGYAIAQRDPRVLFVNSRKLTDQLGWRSPATAFLAEPAHYTPYGGREKARVEAEAILGRFGCAPDVNHDGFLDFFDYDDFVTAFETGQPASIADFNGDSFTDFFDYDTFVQAFEVGC